jgi:flagellar basal body P-ring formation protein FlgA
MGDVMVRVLCLLVMVFFLAATPAGAAPEHPGGQGIAWRSEARAAGEYILFKDLAELSPALAQTWGQVPVWSAPLPGQVYTLTGEFLRYRLTQLGVGGLLREADLPAAIQVHQTGVLLAQEQVAEAFQRYIQKHSHWPQDQVRVDVFPLEEPIYMPDKNAILEVLPPRGGRLVGDVTLEMALGHTGQVAKRFKVSGKVNLEQEVACAARPLTPQTVIKPDDVRLSRRDVTHLGADEFFASLEPVVGRLLSRPLGPHEIVTHRHLSQQPVINRGDEVTVVLDENGLVVTTKGVAREPGYPNRAIRILNPRSKREFQAQVVDSKTVKVTL